MEIQIRQHQTNKIVVLAVILTMTVQTIRNMSVPSVGCLLLSVPIVALLLVLCATPTSAFLATGSGRQRNTQALLNRQTVSSSLSTATATATATVTTSATSLHATQGQDQHVVALTREVGKNDKLHKALTDCLDESVRLVELPCIAHADGPDLDRLPSILRNKHFDYVAVTSPEAAKVLSTAWTSVQQERENDDGSLPAVTAVGKATGAMLEKLGIPVAFCPSKATAKTLVVELPSLHENDNNDDADNDSNKNDSNPTSLLYPASAKAATTLQDGLTKRGFVVTRLDTYDTVTAEWTDHERQEGSNVDIVCFGSPSAVQGWLANTNVNTDSNDANGKASRVMAACIG